MRIFSSNAHLSIFLYTIGAYIGTISLSRSLISMSTTSFRNYLVATEELLTETDVLSHNSVWEKWDITNDDVRNKVVYNMGQTRHLIRQFMHEFFDDEMYEKDPNKLKSNLYYIRKPLVEVERLADRKTGLYKDKPTTEYRIINDALVNTLIHAKGTLDKLIDNKQKYEIKRFLYALENDLLERAKEIFEAMGRDTRRFNSYFEKSEYNRDFHDVMGHRTFRG